ncbi:SHOCT domain-containing protein [Rhizobium sp. TRM95111]|uniref:SHOCT domain-containing protein n=1 Tax=Rhizobium alarense TaxID=2846851 RepID=UPI001F208122|nr:SHOCT domain-containing protein [Rhizobium alarense]MCF3643074.1 SHOCT domain-containing protein [Rhizobium alarense]
MALIAGHGTQAQFNHPDLGGMGQWSQGGMTMVGDMFNNALKAKVDGICSELAALVRDMDLAGRPASYQSQSQNQGGGVSLFVPGAFSAGNWWPADLGHPSSTGAQNNLRYAFFPETGRLAIDIGGRITVYDTKDHRIGGFSQQQGGDQSLSFTSQHGLVRVSELDEVARPGTSPGGRVDVAASGHDMTPEAATVVAESGSAVVPQAPSPTPERSRPVAEDDIFGKIERLAALHAKGIVTDKEFEAKKADLLDRL